MAKMLYRDAVRMALEGEMLRDEDVFLIGEDIGLAGGDWKCTEGLQAKFGPWRVMDSPISESGFTGLGVGAAIVGMRPVVEIMFGDFLFVAMDQICNQAAKITYMSGGQVAVPLTIRTCIGSVNSSAAQHSQMMHSMFAHCPGLKVVLPSTPYEVKGLLKTAIRENSPVLFYEHKRLYSTQFEVPEEEYTIPFGVARIAHPGKDLTVVATSYMAILATKVAEELEKDGISVEVIDPRTIVPLDRETICRSVKKTGRLLIVDEGHASYGISGEIAMAVMEKNFYDLDAPIERMCAADVPVPFSPVLEQEVIPDEKAIRAAILRMLDI